MVYGYNNAAKSYMANSVNYASKEQLLLMILDGAVKFSKKAKHNLEEGDVKGAHENLTKTQNIFVELMTSLNLEEAGEWGSGLLNVYEFINRRLMDANIKKDVNILDEVLPLIEDIRDTWNEAYKISKVK